MKKKFNGRFSYKKDIGKVRITNEDDTKILLNSHGDLLMMVADGMGGYNKGDFASSEIIHSLSESFISKKRFLSVFQIKLWLTNNLRKINKKIYDLSEKDPVYKGMGSTIIIAFLFNNKLIIANAGDSRAYILNKKEFKQVSDDHSYVNYLYKSGQIKKEEIKVHPSRHVLTNAIGIYPSLSLEFNVLHYNKESILLCSDGLYNNLKENDIENILRTNEDTSDKVLNLINIANYNGGSDNISIALWECLDD